MSCLNKDQIFAINDYKIERVDVPEWGGHVYVKVITAKQREVWENTVVTGSKEEGALTSCELRILLVLMSCCDEAGNLLFTVNDFEALKAKSIVAFDRIYEASCKFNVVTRASIEDEKKDSEKTPSVCSNVTSE